MLEKDYLIFIAEDDEDDKEFFLDALSEIPIKCRTEVFQNGIDLMDKLFSTTEIPDIIFLDLRMPLMDGFECLTDIRNFKKFSEIKIVVYSTSYHDREVRQLEEDGANRYLQKPSSFNILKTLLYQSIKSLEPQHAHSDKKFVILA